jgi:UDP-N-acetylmuramoylalanine--D-glutamate ligase
VKTFRGLAHRLQLVAEHNDVRYYNDSKSTTPTSAMLAIDSFPAGSVHIVLGGYDKHADLTEMAHHAAGACAAIYTIGHTGPAIAKAAEAVSGHCPVHHCGILEVAVRTAVQHTKPGQAVVLSPGCASWDQYENYEKRGSHFAECVLRFTHNE